MGFTNGSVLQELGWEWSAILMSHVLLVEGVLDLGHMGGRSGLMEQKKKSPDLRSPVQRIVKIMTVNRSI